MGDAQELDLRRQALVARYPRLASTYFRFTSPDDPSYNCYAFAGNDTRRCWAPHAFGGCHWPLGPQEEETVEIFVAAFGRLGYAPCESAEIEQGIEKVAIYAR